MPELRRDPVVGYWTIISTERSQRPVAPRQRAVSDERECPFCEGHESRTTSEVYAARREGTKPNGPGWDVRTIASKTPILSSDAALDRYGEGLYDLMEGAGHHEIIVESPKHKHDLDELAPAEIEKVVGVWARRILDLAKDPRFKFALLFKNHGVISGQGQDIVRHSRSQLIALPIIPKRVKEELLAAKAHYDRRERCVFCDVLRQETSDRSRIVAENDSFLAFCPFASRAPFEIWILPKRHSPDFGQIASTETPAFASILKDTLSRLRNLLDDPPYNTILHTAPYRHGKKEYWKTLDEDYHWYYQISPRLTRAAGFEWGTGIHINPTPPEEAARLMRETAPEVR